MKRYWFVCVFVLGCFLIQAEPQTDSLIRVLHQLIDTKNNFVSLKLQRIDQLKKEQKKIAAGQLREEFDIVNKLYHEYKTFIYDSAFRYAVRLIQISNKLNDRTKIDYARVKLGFILISSGMFKETFDSLGVVDVNYLPDSVKIEHYSLTARAFYDLAEYNNDHHFRNEYTARGNAYMDSARALTKPDSYYHFYLTGLKNLKTGNFQGARENLNHLLEKFDLTLPQVAVNSHNLSIAYLALGETDKAIELMMRASLADIHAATKETAAMYTLAELLYKKGDIQNAYIFIQQAMDDAIYYGARQRKVQIGSILPLIASAQLNDVETQRRKWLLFSGALAALSVLVLVFAFIIYKQFKKLKKAELAITRANAELQLTNHKLWEANKIKEGYLGYYFNATSDYLSKIENLKTAVDHKLTVKKFDEIRYLVSAINGKHEREELYSSFDKVFLKLFPDFVTTFNSYFKPEDQFVLKDNQLLNTELRIFALIRMGISDTDKIARILDYSVNTIYAYKNRVKSKAMVPNDEFEKKIMDIRSV